MQDDLISRQAVMDCIDGYSSMIIRPLKLKDYIDELTPVNPQKTGHWIDDKCSICGKGIEDLIDSREWYKNEAPNYCPFCGARMENEDTECQEKKQSDY